MSRKKSLYPRGHSRERTMATSDIRRRKKASRGVQGNEEDNEQDNDVNTNNFSTQTVTVNHEVQVGEVAYVELAGTEELDDDKMESYASCELQFRMDFFSLYNSSFEYTDGQRIDAEGEGLTEALIVVLTDPPNKTRRGKIVKTLLMRCFQRNT